MAAPQRIVYWGSGSGPAWRVLIALKLSTLVVHIEPNITSSPAHC